VRRQLEVCWVDIVENRLNAFQEETVDALLDFESEEAILEVETVSAPNVAR
jgi:hypothetical protein